MMDSSLYAMPEGEAKKVISVELPDVTTNINDDGSIEVILGEPEKEKKEDDFYENLAETISDDLLLTFASDVLDDIQSDLDSRKDWAQMYVDGLDLLGMKLEERTEPWIGACGVYHPIMSEALVRFQAETVMSTLPPSGPVKTKVIGEETPQKTEAATRVCDDMNHQLTDVMTEYRPEHERTIWGVGLSGNAFKKIYECPIRNRQVALFVPGEDVIVPYGSSDLKTAPRVTHMMRKTKNELRKLIVSGFYKDIGELDDPIEQWDEIEKKIAENQGFTLTNDGRYKIYECHADLDIGEDPDGIELPYIITIEKTSRRVLGLRRNWKEGDETRTRREHFVHYCYIPGFGFYAFGLIHVLGAYARSGTSILRQLVDAGELSNLPGGFKTRGARIKNDETPIAPGEFRDVDVAEGVLKDNIVPLPFKEPSAVLAQLLDKIIEEGRRFASAADLQTSDMSANSPVGSTLAILERQLKVISAVQSRIHYAMKQEFVLLKELIANSAPTSYDYQPVEGSRKAKRSDYEMVEVIPVSDPNASTMAQKVVQYQAVMQLAQAAPQIYNMPYLHRQMIDVLGVKNAEKIVKLPEDQKPVDPVSENMAVITGKPVKAFMYQDHQGHIAVHMAAMQDPKIMQLIGQSPKAQEIASAAQAHIAEHIAYEYRKQMEQLMGQPLPDEKHLEDGIPKELEVMITRMATGAANQLLQRNTQEMAAQAAQQAAQDPLVQMQQQELAIKQQEVQIKAEQAAAQAQVDQVKLELENKRIDTEKEIAAMKIGADVGKSKFQTAAQHELEGMRIGNQIGQERTKLMSQQELEGMKLGNQIGMERERMSGERSRHETQLSHDNTKHQRDTEAKVKMHFGGLVVDHQKHRDSMGHESKKHEDTMGQQGKQHELEKQKHSDTHELEKQRMEHEREMQEKEHALAREEHEHEMAVKKQEQQMAKEEHAFAKEQHKNDMQMQKQQQQMAKQDQMHQQSMDKKQHSMAKQGQQHDQVMQRKQMAQQKADKPKKGNSA